MFRIDKDYTRAVINEIEIQTQKKPLKTIRTIAKKDRRMANHACEGILRFYQAFPEHYDMYEVIMTRELEQGKIDPTLAPFFEGVLKSVEPEYRKPLLELFSDLQKRGDFNRGCDIFIYNANNPLPKTACPPDPDHLLLAYIHNLETANFVSKNIDMKKYGKEYAEKCGKFY
jgi:hypothetical protein